MATVLISGGTGLIGTALTKILIDKGYNVTILTRKPPTNVTQTKGISYAIWDINAGTIDATAIRNADYIVHLAGAGVAEKRWSAKRKKEIAESRTRSGALIAKALSENDNHVKAVISSSAIGWYGPDTEYSLKHGFTESDEHDDSFLGNTCYEWEQAIAAVESLGKRLVYIRTGIVLSNQGGAYVEFKKPVKFGIAAILGGGNQVVSWIHIEDICRMFLFAIENDINGSYNGVAPMPITNKELTLQIATKLRGRYFIPVFVPAFILKILLGEMSIEVLKSANVSAEKIRKAGFRFLYPSADAALSELTRSKS